ncbi:MAG TPA: hypothetical protein H9717_00715 [Candidatus Eisenbergiella merdipullorum]|uniref:ABC-2 type transport system permease protein n=1 Tax=Candidatus Eisenbergiella merdipullorum TaxID=2838553 RepID=A0A9D2I1Q2_9FIRM|nr:hypothetical protein [Candidatus Eisenbergiella merdipullorum]
MREIENPTVPASMGLLGQSALLIRLKLRNCLGLNEVLHGKDGRKSVRLTGMLLVYMLLAGMMIFYIAAAAFLLCLSGAGESVPSFAVLISGAVIFLFSFLKAGAFLFDPADLERLTPLPLSPTAVIVSRFFILYAEELLFSAVTVLPASLVYLLMERPGAGFLPLTLFALPFQPFLPLTAAAVVGTLLLAAGAGMKHKRAVTLILTTGFSMLLVTGSFAFSFSMKEPDVGKLGETLKMAVNAGCRFYPPAGLYAAGVMGRSTPALLLFVGLSAGIFAIFAAVTGPRFRKISGAIWTDARSRRSAGDRFLLSGLRQRPVWRAEYIRELRRYFASNIYVSNTLVIYLLMVVLASALAVMGNERIAAAMQMPEDETRRLLRVGIPFLMAFLAAMGNTTPVSISMEGKQLWLLQSLPIRPQAVFLGKILVNLTVSVPSVLLSALAVTLGGWADGIWTTAFPLVFLWPLSALGIWINRKLPSFDWESETAAVKQSLSLLVSMLAGCLIILPAAVMIFILEYLPGQGTLTGLPEFVVKGAILLLALFGGTLLYRSCCRSIAFHKDFC